MIIVIIITGGTRVGSTRTYPTARPCWTSTWTRPGRLYHTLQYCTVLYINVLYCPRFGVLKLQWLAGRIKEKLQGVIIVRFVNQIEVVKVHHP